jgi:hypothetical protein
LAESSFLGLEQRPIQGRACGKTHLDDSLGSFQARSSDNGDSAASSQQWELAMGRNVEVPSHYGNDIRSLHRLSEKIAKDSTMAQETKAIILESLLSATNGISAHELMKVKTVNANVTVIEAKKENL